MMRRQLTVLALVLAAFAASLHAQQERDGAVQEKIDRLLETIRTQVMQAKAATEQLAALGEVAVPAFERLLKDDNALHKQWAVIGLLRIGSEKSNAIAVEQLEMGHPETRKVAAYYARLSADKSVRDALAARIDDEKSPGVLFWVLRAVTESGPGRFPGLGEKFAPFLTGGDEKLQILAVNGLVAWKPEGWLDKLLGQFAREDKPGVIVKLLDVFALQKHAVDKVAPVVRSALDNPSKTIRLKAAVAYGQLAPPDAAAVLVKRLAAETDDKVKAGLLALIGKTGDRGAATVDGLVAALQSDDPSVQMYAVAVLRQVTGKAFGYSPRGTVEEKAAAVTGWTDWWAGARKSWKGEPEKTAP